jgi:hypothetical protein
VEIAKKLQNSLSRRSLNNSRVPIRPTTNREITILPQTQPPNDTTKLSRTILLRPGDGLKPLHPTHTILEKRTILKQIPKPQVTQKKGFKIQILTIVIHTASRVDSSEMDYRFQI